jgi:hypothetical protein
VKSGAAKGEAAIDGSGNVTANLTGTVGGTANATVLSGAAKGEAAIDGSGNVTANLTGTVGGTANATVLSGAAKGEAAIDGSGNVTANLTGTVAGTSSTTVKDRAIKSIEEYVIYSDNTQSGTGITDMTNNLSLYSRNAPAILGTDTVIVTAKVKFIYRHLATNKNMVLRAWCKQAANTRDASITLCQLVLGLDDITSTGPNVTLMSPTTSVTFDTTELTALDYDHGSSYALVTVTEDISGLTAGNLYEITVAMRGGLADSEASVTMTMYGLIVAVTGS